MRGRLRVSVPGPAGHTHQAGEQVTLVESEIFCDVDIAGRREVLPLEDLRRTCEVPGCERRAEYIAPGDWCAHHWNEWWSVDDDEPWMRNDRERPAPAWAVARDLSLEDGTKIAAGAPVEVVARSLMVMVEVEGEPVPFQLHRTQLSIECVVPGCGCEAAQWTPRYLCTAHWETWAKGNLDLESLPEEMTA